MDQKVWPGDRINEGFFFFTRICMAVLPGGQNNGRNNEVTVFPRWPATDKAGFHCIIVVSAFKM